MKKYSPAHPAQGHTHNQPKPKPETSLPKWEAFLFIFSRVK
jgi:hypothetical protein